MAQVARRDRRLPKRNMNACNSRKSLTIETYFYINFYAYFVFDSTCATFSFTIPGKENHRHGMLAMDTSNEK